LEHVDPKWFIASHQHVDSEVKLVPIDQEGVSNVSTDDRCVIHVDIIDIIYNIDTFALRRVGWLHYPDILLGVMLFQLLIMRVEIAEFIREDVSIRHKIKVLLSKAFLHSHHIIAKPILSGDFIALRVVIDLLELIKTLVDVRLAA
jgi:hypothetical protein